jgi:iron complex transport system ATP-binding protein
VARKLSLVGQPLDGPLDLTVEELVQRGRFPHQGLFWRDARADREAVEWALDAMRLQAIRHRSIRQLSHGELRRAWTAVALAQRPDILLLDEPTAFLDVAHQFQLLDLISRLRDHGVGIVMALHDLWLTALYCQRVVVMDKGRVVAYGPTEEVLTVDLVRDVFQVEAVMTCHPITGKRIPFPCGVVVRRQGAPASDTETSETEGAGALPEPGDSPSPH